MSRLTARFLPHFLCHLEIEATAKVLQVAMFYSSLQVAISRSWYCNLNLKPKQVQCLQVIYSGRDVVAVLPRRDMVHGKSLIFHLVPSLFLKKINYSQPHVPSASVHPVIVVVSPLKSTRKIAFKRLPLSPGLSRDKFYTYPPLPLIFCLLHPRFWDTRDQTGPGSLLARPRGRLDERPWERGCVQN